MKGIILDDSFEIPKILTISELQKQIAIELKTTDGKKYLTENGIV